VVLQQRISDLELVYKNGSRDLLSYWNAVLLPSTRFTGINLAYFNLKIGCLGNVPWAIGKRFKSVIYDQISTIRWTFG